MPARYRMTASDSGFVLIGVVVFVLALTILVLSLYGLSSYEAQFFQRSLDGEQAFQSAVGGIERAKCRLVQTSLLQSVADSLPLENVTTALAIQDSNSTGAVHWQGTDVTIRVTAQVNGQERTIEGQFTPHQTQNYYSKVITTSREIVVEDSSSAGGPKTDRRFTVDLRGAVWEGISPPDFSTWTPILHSQPDSIRTTPVPTPDLATYFASHPVSAATPAPHITSPEIFTLTAPQNDVAYFCAPNGSSRNDFYYNTVTSSEIKVLVQGLAVWEFPRGLRFDGLLRISALGGGNCCLVIVTGQTGPQPAPENDPEMGIRLFSGVIVEPGISLIIVSNGRVYIQHLDNASGTTCMAGDVAIYSQNLWLTGSDQSPPAPITQKYMILQHLVTGDLDKKYIPLLSGTLPGSNLANGNSLALVPGTWRVYPQ